MRIAVCLLICAGMIGCGDDGGSGTEDVAISFNAVVGSDAFACDTTFSDLGTTNSTLTATDFRFYVHDFRLVDADDNEAPVTLSDDGMWQDGTVALLDFADCTSGDSGNVEMNGLVRGSVAPGTYTGLRFKIGVPFDSNHTDVTAASTEPPLNLTDMAWNWLGGRKFLRLDGDTREDGDDETGINGWRFHLGSTVCSNGTNGDPNNPAAPPLTVCMRPNVAEVSLSAFDASANQVVVNIAALVETANLDADTTPGTGGDTQGCMANPSDLDCKPMYDSMGLPFGDDPAPTQTFITAE